MHLSWPSILGLFGVVLINIAYLMLSYGRLSPNKTPYHVLNLTGGLCILLSLFYDWNLSAFVMELSWVLISSYGMYRSLQQK